MGNIYSALRELQALKAGTSNVTGVYVGSDLIWPLITPTPTITPTSTFTPTPTSTPTVTPTNTITPTVTSTNTPTPTITPYPVCPQQLEITQTNELRIDVGTYTRATIASGTTFDYGYFDQTQFVIGRAPDGNYYPIYQYISGDTNTLYRGFSGSTDLGWYGREEFLNPLFNPPPYIGGQRTFGSDYITVGDARFFKSGSNTGLNPGFEPENVTIYIQYSIVCPTPTPTVTPTNTQTPTVTPTNTQTPTVTPTNTPTNTPTQTVTPTPSVVVPTITYITNLIDNAAPNPTTFTSVNWGAPGFIVVAAAGRQSSAASVTSVTIAGVSATLLVGREGTGNRIALYGATMTGTSGNIVVTFSQGQATSGIGVWRLNNLKSTTPISTNSNASSFATGISMNLTANTGTNVIICAQSMSSGSNAIISSSTTTRNYTATSEIVYAHAGFSDISTTSGTYTFTSTHVNTGSPSNPGNPTVVGVIFQ